MAVSLSPPGLVCCAGNSPAALFDAALRGDRRGIQPLSPAGDKRFFAGCVLDLPPVSGCRGFPETRLFQITAAALEQIRPAVEAAAAEYGPDRVGVCAGSCDNGSELSLPAHRALFTQGAFPPDYAVRFQGAAFIAEFAAARFGLGGPCFTTAAACASGASAIVKGAELIEAGFCDAVIAGGADIVSETVLLGFLAMEAVSSTICNPFSKNRDGITLGEGAAFFLLRRAEAPAEKNDVIPGIELLGYGESADACHMTAPRPDGSGAASAMRSALASAGVMPGDVDYINLHGTGTVHNDRMEALALQAVFRETMPPVSSTKPVTGHTLGAAGALELAVCWMCLNQESSSANTGLPVHCWDGEADSEMPSLNFAGNRKETAQARICMSNSFAFGGCNVSLVIGRRDNG